MDVRGNAEQLQRRVSDAAAHPLAKATVERVTETALVTRAMGLASRAFTAVIPAVIVVQAAAPLFGEKSFGETLVARYGVTGKAADALLVLFPSPEDVRGGVTAAGVALVLIAALTFGRAFQAFVEDAWRVPPGGLRESWRGLVFLLLVLGLMFMRSLVRNVVGTSALGDVVTNVLFLSLSLGFWLLTGRLLLRGERSWHAMLPAAVTLALASLATSIGSSVVMPEILASNTAKFGVIGAVFSLLSLFVVLAYVTCGATVFGAVLSDAAAGRIGTESGRGPAEG